MDHRLDQVGQNLVLNLLFPQWQGANNIALYRGAKQLCDALSSKKTFVEVPIASTYSMTIEENVLGLSQLSAQLTSASSIIKEQNPERIFTLGGDCGVEIAPISFLNQKHNGIAVVWLDAHGDLNTPTSSPSKHFHGMPLRSLLGQGSACITRQAFSTLMPSQVFLVGARDLDRPEKTFVSQNGLRLFSVNSVNERENASLLSAIKAAGFHKLYIHLDLDVIDPIDFPYVACQTPKGIEIEHLKQLLSELIDGHEIVGASILEYLPTDSDSDGTLIVSKLTDILRFDI